MTDQHSFAYEWCDIPEGLSVADYRRLRAVPRHRRIRHLWIRRRGSAS